MLVLAVALVLVIVISVAIICVTRRNMNTTGNDMSEFYHLNLFYTLDVYFNTTN